MQKLCSKLPPAILCLCSVTLLSLPWYGLGGFSALLGFVPLLILRQRLVIEQKKGFLWWVALTIALWHIVTCFWVSYATILAAPAVPLVCTAMLWPAFAAFHYVAKLSRSSLAYLTLITGWVLAEWYLAYGDFGFGWLNLGAAWADMPQFVQWYSITGTYGGSLWALICSVLVYLTIEKRVSIFITLCAIVLPMVVSLSLYFGTEAKSSGEINVAIIQPNIDAYQKYNSNGAQAQFNNILELASKAPKNTQLYIAPETALVRTIHQQGLNSSSEVIALQNFLRSKGGGLFIIGATTYDGVRGYNSVLYIDTTSVEVYHKRKLVFGVEIVPEWVESLVGMLDLGGYVGSLGRSSESVVGSIDGHNVGAVVCYESIYGDMMTEWIDKGAELMAIITNDGWWGNTPGHRHHFNYARLRAIELGRTIVRSANTGISGVIDRKGSVVERLGWDERGEITATVPLYNSTTTFTRWGNAVVRLSGLVFGLCLLYSLALWYRRRDELE